MRIQQFVAAAFVGILSVSAFAAPSVPPSQSPAATTVNVQASLPSASRLPIGEAQRMKGTFKLDDGRTLVLTDSRNRLYAELDGKREELVKVGEKGFVARDSGTRLTFDQVPFASEVVLNSAR